MNDRLAAAPEAITVGIAGMQLPDRGDRKPGDPVLDIGLQLNELDGRGERAEIDRKARVRLLSMQCLPKDRVTAVNADHIARDVCRAKEREPHDVVPMHMRQQDVETMRSLRPVLRQYMVAELTRTGA